MPRADLLLDIVKAGAEGNQQLFRKALEAMIAEERAKRHNVVADRANCETMWFGMAAQGNHVDGTLRAGLKPAPTVAVPVVVPVGAPTIAAYHTISWHQRQTNTSVNSAKGLQINPVSLYYCVNGRLRRGGFQTRQNHRRTCCHPNHRHARRHPHHRCLCYCLLCLPSESPSEYSDYAIGSAVSRGRMKE